MTRVENVKKITTISILIALSVVFSYFDSLISMGLIMIIPGLNVIIGAIFYEFRIGLANIVILLLILNLNFKDAFLAAFLKALIVGLFFIGSTPIKLLIGLGGTMLSFFVMELLNFLIKNKSKKNIIIISMIGGVAHGIGQIFVVYMIMKLNMYAILFTFLPSYVLSGIISGAFIGSIVYTTDEYVNKTSIGLFQKKSV